MLRGLGVVPVTIGAYAALVYRASPRTTTDVDLLVERVEGIREAFEERGYTVREMTEPGGTEPFLYIAEREGARIDVLIVDTPYQREALARSVDGYLAIEDVIIHKLIAWRPADQDDVRSILAAGHQLDHSYIERWAAEWGVMERWQEVGSWKESE